LLPSQKILSASNVKIFHATLVTILGCTLLPLAIGLLFIFPFFSQQTEQLVINELTGIANLQVSRLKDAHKQALQKLGLISSRTQLRISLENFEETGAIASQEKMTRILMDARNSVQDLELIEVLNLEGKIVASTEPDRVGQAQYEAKWVANALKSTFADEFQYSPGKAPLLRANGPLTIKEKTVGCVVAYWNTTGILHVVATRNALGETGETLLGKQIEEKLALIVPGRFTSTKGSLDDPLLKEAVSGTEKQWSHAKDYRGKEVIAVTRNLPEMDWGVVVKRDRTEALLPVTELKEKILYVGIGITILAIGGAIIASKSMSRPIIQLAKVSDQIAQGNLDVRADKSTRVSELQSMAQSYNAMAESLVRSQRDLEEKVKKRTSQLEASNEKLRRSNLDLEQFAFIASHDLQTPVRNVQTAATLFKDEIGIESLDESKKYYLDAIDQSCARIQAQISGLLTFSRVLTKGDPTEGEVDTKEIVNESLEESKSELQKAEANVQVGELPMIMADKNLLQMVFQNIIDNAIQYREYDRPLKVQIYSETSNGNHVFTIEDNGIGIKEKFRTEIFKMFRRLHKHTTRPGTGIGLGLCQKIIERHGGRIWVEPNTKLGHGSIFRFSIPSTTSMVEKTK